MTATSLDVAGIAGLSSDELLDRLAEHGVEIKAPVDLDKIASVLGIKIDRSVDLSRLSVVGSISYKNNTPFVWLNPLENDYEPRERFTLAHEIGHFVLHLATEDGQKEFIDSGKTLSRRSSYWDTKEYQANNFAANLLMPRRLVKEVGLKIISEYKAAHGNDAIPEDYFVREFMNAFKVSRPAAEYRLKNLGLIS